MGNSNGKRKGNGGTAVSTRPRAIAGKQHVAAMNAGRIFLAITDRVLIPDELRLVYQSVYPKAELTEADQRLQQGQVMTAEAVAAELGADMQQTYDFLVSSMHFLSAGTRPHNEYTDLPRHLWDTAYRAQFMGLPLEQRQLALMHSLPEYKARGLEEARKVIRAISESSGMKVATGLEGLTDWDAILLDHLRHVIERIGVNGNSDNPSYLRDRLAKISRKEDREKLERILDDVVKLSPQSDKRLVPVALVGNPVYPEARARLHQSYAENLAGEEDLLAVKGLCLIDRLRTADSMPQVEKATRETLDFVPHFDRTCNYLRQQKGSVNNVLEFVAAALKTELLVELDQRTAEARSRRDTRFEPFAAMMERRLAAARQQYGKVAISMGYTFVAATPNLRFG